MRMEQTEWIVPGHVAVEPERWRWLEYERRKAAILVTNPEPCELETRLRKEAEELDL